MRRVAWSFMYAARTVDGIIHPIVELVNLASQTLGIKIQTFGIIIPEQTIKRSVEYPDYLRALVVDDCSML